MSKITLLIRVSCVVLVITGCVPFPMVAPTVCAERDLQQASQPITTTFKDSKLEEMSLGSDLYAGHLEVSPDGSKLAFLVYRGSAWTPDGVYVFDTSNGRLNCILPPEHNGAIFEDIAFSPSELLSVSTHIDGTVVVRHSESGEIIRELKTIKYDSPSWIDFSADGSRLVTSGSLQPARVWDIDTGQLIASVDSAHVILSPDGKFLTIPEADGIKIINIDSQEVKVAIEYAEAKVDFLFSPDGNYLYLLNSFSEVMVWNVHSGEIINKLNPTTDYDEFNWEKPMRLSLSTDGARLLMENPTKIIVWDTRSWQEQINSHGTNIDKSVPIVDAVIMPNGQTAVVNYSYNTIRFWSLSP